MTCRSRLLFCSLLAAGAALGLYIRALSGEEPPGDDPIVASVNGRAIRLSRLEQAVADLRSRRPWPQAWDSQVRSLLLAQLVDRWIVLEYLGSHSAAATPADVDQAMRGLEAELQARGRTLSDYLKQLSLTADQLRDELLWSLSWRRYLDRFLTDENAQRFFERHRRHFDGTRRKVAHIVWKVDSPEEVEKYLAEARRVREEILAGKIRFADAAARYSQSPTGASGGNLGWIERHQPMPESFSRAAFDLELGKVSEPIITRIGVHLIQCLEEEPGTRRLEDVRGEVEAAMAAYLFRWSADRHRAEVTLEWNEQLVPRPDKQLAEWLERSLPLIPGNR
ncbi:MAG: hypothetical protein KatS3mg110_2440 [Pirellulaceae bacterium]|nr:MAG: hypothetical protein KatS3mg110_2440 [Pirellulaceae bacterium]